MKTRLAAVVALLAVTPAAFATDVGVSIAISQPGVYGRIDVGHFPQPAVIVSQPVIIAPQPAVIAPQPIYMWVPYGHRKHWDKHCRKYNACGVPVYFVRHDWYEQHVRYQGGPHEAEPYNHGKGKGKSNGKGRGKD